MSFLEVLAVLPAHFFVNSVLHGFMAFVQSDAASAVSSTPCYTGANTTEQANAIRQTNSISQAHAIALAKTTTSIQEGATAEGYVG